MSKFSMNQEIDVDCIEITSWDVVEREIDLVRVEGDRLNVRFQSKIELDDYCVYVSNVRGGEISHESEDLLNVEAVCHFDVEFDLKDLDCCGSMILHHVSYEVVDISDVTYQFDSRTRSFSLNQSDWIRIIKENIIDDFDVQFSNLISPEFDVRLSVSKREFRS